MHFFRLKPEPRCLLGQLEKFGSAIQLHVDAIYLVHGTFVGKDALGWTAQIEKLWPQAAVQLRELGKMLVDALADDSGNFTDEYADRLQQELQPYAPNMPGEAFQLVW